jgi:phosphatidylglycerophosphatase A
MRRSAAPGDLRHLPGNSTFPRLNQLASQYIYGALVVLIGCTAWAIWLSGKADTILIRKDPQVVVIDEITGFFIANFFNQQKLSSLAVAFIVFRFSTS